MASSCPKGLKNAARSTRKRQLYNKARDVLTARVVPADTDPVTHLDHNVVWPGHGDELITFDARFVEGRNDQTARHEHIGPELQIDAGHLGNSTYQNLEIETTADQDGSVAWPEHDQVADTPGQCSQVDQSGNLIGSDAASSNGPEAQSQTLTTSPTTETSRYREALRSGIARYRRPILASRKPMHTPNRSKARTSSSKRRPFHIPTALRVRTIRSPGPAIAAILPRWIQDASGILLIRSQKLDDVG